MDADGDDDIVGTEDDNLRLYAGSPCVDAGDNAGVPAGLTLDLDGNDRFADYPGAPDTGNGTPPIVDMGAYEFQCGGVQCPQGTISGSDPLNGTLDARQPNPPDSTSPRQGIGSQERSWDRVYMFLAPPVGGAEDPCCWGLCETNAYPEGSNRITGVTETADGVYEIKLDRAITAGAVTTIQYIPSGDFVEYTAHPANVNADSRATPTDILRIIDYLNGVGSPPWGIYSTDIDHSGVFNPPDILRVIDLLNGAGVYDPWLWTFRPTNDACPPGYGFAGLGGGEDQSVGIPSEETSPAADDIEQFGAGFVRYLAMSNPLASGAEAEFRMIVEALTGFCVQNLSPTERAKLADKLRDPSLTFASETATAMLPQIVNALLK